MRRARNFEYMRTYWKLPAIIHSPAWPDSRHRQPRAPQHPLLVEPPRRPHAVGDGVAEERSRRRAQVGVAGGQHDDVGLDLAAVRDADAGLGDAVDAGLLDLDLALNDQPRAADVHVVAAAALHVGRDEPAVLDAP